MLPQSTHEEPGLFGWLTGRKRRQQEMLEGMMRAAAEGAQRAKVNQALGSRGVQLDYQADNTQYCIKASSAIVTMVTSEVGQPLSKMSPSQQWFAGVYSFVVSNHITAMVGAPFETVATIVPVALFGSTFASRVPEIGDAYNTLASHSDVVEALGQTTARWLNEPSSANFQSIVKLYTLVGDRASG